MGYKFQSKPDWYYIKIELFAFKKFSFYIFYWRIRKSIVYYLQSYLK